LGEYAFEERGQSDFSGDCYGLVLQFDYSICVARIIAIRQNFTESECRRGYR
jgi:hypothetical protein